MVVGDKMFRPGQFAGAGESKLQGRGEVDENLRSLMTAAEDAVKAGHLPPTFVQGLVRSLAVAKQNGFKDVLDSVEKYEEMLREGALGTVSGIRAVKDIKERVNNKLLGAVSGSFF